jgi:hypothetical protein|tara:strand:+ start:13834 stop:14100 length:267 start_codon:yes stop_codon:yes gene_type:complete
MYIEGLDYPTLERELRSLFETAPELSSRADPMFDNDTWEDVYAYVDIRDKFLGFEVTYDGGMPFVDDLLAEFLELIADEYDGTFIENY